MRMEEARKIAAERNYYFQFSRWEDMPDDLKDEVTEGSNGFC